jgi:hypothetical protein
LQETPSPSQYRYGKPQVTEQARKTGLGKDPEEVVVRALWGGAKGDPVPPVEARVMHRPISRTYPENG